MAKLCVIFVLVLVVVHANAHKVPSDGGHHDQTLLAHGSAPEVTTPSDTKLGDDGFAVLGGLGGIGGVGKIGGFGGIGGGVGGVSLKVLIPINWLINPRIFM